MKRAERWLAFGDIHDDLSALDNLPGLGDAKGVILTGDLTFNGGCREAERVLRQVSLSGPALFAQIGNMDREEVTGLLRDKGWNMHGEAVEAFPGLVLMGLGGSSPTPFGTPSEFSEKRLAAFLDEGHGKARQLLHACRDRGMARPVLVLVSHCPPHGTACDRLGGGGHAGSLAVRDFIERVQPDLCLCGHIHESRAEDRLGETRIMNPGDLRSGGYIALDLETGQDGPAVAASLVLMG